ERALREFLRRGHTLTRRIAEFPKPIIVAVNGLAYGTGCELPEAAPLAVAAQHARLAMTEIAPGSACAPRTIRQLSSYQTASAGPRRPAARGSRTVPVAWRGARAARKAFTWWIRPAMPPSSPPAAARRNRVPMP
ncbi:hypothetical protein VM98_33785, partial [Streptomyces rubellomurinus subsp. indigoferus]